MYNRYIPGADGTFQRQTLPDCPPPPPGPPPGPPKPPKPPEPPKPKPCLSEFFGSLIPGGLDAEDLIVVLLLLLMSQDCKESPNTPLITMLIYLFL